MVFHKAIRKYGEDSFEWRLLESNIDNQSLLNSLERLHIARYESLVNDWGYNTEIGGSNGALSESTKQKLREVMTGRKVSEETRAKMSESQKGRIAWNKGIPMTDERKEENRQWSKKNGYQCGSDNPMYGNHGKYRGTYYARPSRNPWTKVWKTNYCYNGHVKFISQFHDPISGQLVYDLIKDAIEGGVD
jgi:hypothetical protein